MSGFPHLFAPLALRHKTLKSRLVFGAHTANMAEGGLPGERHRAYYEARAKGGAAMIVVEPIPVHWPLRQKLQKLGVHTLTDAALTAWRGDAAEVVDLRDGTSERIEADALVLATVNQSQTWLQEGLQGSSLELHAIGDCVAPRLAVMAIYEGRELALRL